MVPSILVFLTKKIYTGPPFHICFLNQKNHFLSAKLKIKIKSNMSLPNKNQTNLQQKTKQIYKKKKKN